MFVDFFIHRPVFATVCALLIILAGAAVIPTLPIAQFPDLAPPQVGVSSFYIGASAQTVESAVTIPLEQQINGAEGMKYITSTSGNDGSSNITATFDLTRDPDLATVDIQNRVNIAQGRLPSAVKAVGITTVKTSQNFVFGAAVISDNNKYSTLFMSNYLDVYVRDSLKRIPGVANVIIFGERKYSMRLWLDPVRMAGRALTAPDVVNALAEQNVEVAAGQIGQQPLLVGGQQPINVEDEKHFVAVRRDRHEKFAADPANCRRRGKQLLCCQCDDPAYVIDFQANCARRGVSEQDERLLGL